MNAATRAAIIALYDRFTHEGMDRRLFMAQLSRLAGGATAASLALSGVAARAAAPLVPSDDSRIMTETLAWETSGRTYPLYRAAPRASDASRPAVLVIHENRGLNDHIRDVTRRLAVAGYDAAAPDFLRPAGGTPADEDEARRMIGVLDLERAAADGVDLIRWLAGPGGASRKVGAIGFCWGGAMVNRLAVAAGSGLAAAVPFYGPAPDPSEASRVEAPMLLILAGRDERVNRTAIPWADALEERGKDARVRLFPDVDHAFHNDTSEMRYEPEAARAAWTETLEFLARHLRG